MVISLKRIRNEDIDILTRLFEENNKPVITNTFHPFPLTAETAEWIACQPHKDMFFIAFLDERAVGFSMLRGWEEGHATPSFGTFIDFRNHGHGFGTQVLSRTIEEAKRIGCEKIRLSVYANNPVAIAIYKKNGFVEIERTEIIHFGVRDQKINMIKDLSL